MRRRAVARIDRGQQIERLFQRAVTPQDGGEQRVRGLARRVFHALPMAHPRGDAKLGRAGAKPRHGSGVSPGTS
jgi:hypothetical protein